MIRNPEHIAQCNAAHGDHNRIAVHSKDVYPRNSLMQLTKEQQQIITHSGTHAKVSAVAGSGKTTTMVARVEHLLAQGVPPGRLC